MSKIIKNGKKATISYENTFKKSNQLSLAKFNQTFSLNQMRLFAYFIYATQITSEKVGTDTYSTKFTKADLVNKLEFKSYHLKEINADCEALFDLKVSSSNLSEEQFEMERIFYKVTYNKGEFTFLWNAAFLPHILEINEKYILNNLMVTSKFKSVHSWRLYETLNALYGYFHKKFTKEELMEVFEVENYPTYIANTSRFTKGILDVAIDEINEFSEIYVDYTEIKKGRKVVGFDLHWSIGERVIIASNNLMSEIRALLKAINMQSLNILDIKDPELLIEATNIFRQAKQYEYIDDQTKLNKADAELIYFNLSRYMDQINHILNTKKPESKFYNWLDERE